MTIDGVVEELGIEHERAQKMQSPEFFLEGFLKLIKCYRRVFGDGPRNFEPWSSDEDDTRAGTPLLTTTPHQ
ncbi:hypothetical protein TNCV_3465481 [Trichonephila clavipes]|nr:hypothetical protein TNCV_3465481 [Trichonephila clavipes]